MDSKGRFTKGDPRVGRKPGSVNLIPKTVKAMIEGALDDLGGQAWLVQQAKKHPQAFMALVSRIIPRDMAVSVTHSLEQLVNDSREPIEHQPVKRIEEHGEHRAQ